jgi:hypothetical protein
VHNPDITSGLKIIQLDAVPGGLFGDSPVHFARDERASVTRVIDAARDQISTPSISRVAGLDRLEAAANIGRNVSESPLVRRAVGKVFKIGIGAAAGAAIAHKIRPGRRLLKTGTIAGAAAGALLFSSKQSNLRPTSPTMPKQPIPRTDQLASDLAKSIDQHNPPIRANSSESHTLASLATRLGVSIEEAKRGIADGSITPGKLFSRGGESGPMRFDSNELNRFANMSATRLVGGVIDNSRGNPDEIRLASAHALAQRRKEFSRRVRTVNFARPQPEDEENGTFKRTAVKAGLAGAAIYGLGHIATSNAARQIAASHGQEAADAFINARRGVGAKLLAGWSVAKTGGLGAARGAVGGLLRGQRGLAK